MDAAAVSVGITEEHLRDVYSDPYIAKVGHDHRPAAPIIHSAATYLSAFILSEFAGAFLVIRQSAIEYEVHALLKKRSRIMSRDLGKACIDWMFSNPQIARVTASIIEDNKTTVNYCLKLGFEQEGFKRDACLTCGLLRGIHIMGMTRSDWEK